MLERRSFPVASLRPIASARSAGKSVRFQDESIQVQPLDSESLDKIDIAFFSAGGEISRKYVPLACQADAIAIDNSSVFRMEPRATGYSRNQRRGCEIAPRSDCQSKLHAAIALMALYPLHRVFGVRRIFAASYQAVSGSGTRAIDELKRQTKTAVPGEESRPGSSAFATADDSSPATVYPHPIAFNLLPHVDSFLESGYTREEMKMQNEGRKIMHLPEFCASVTCARPGLPGALGRGMR